MGLNLSEYCHREVIGVFILSTNSVTKTNVGVENLFFKCWLMPAELVSQPLKKRPPAFKYMKIQGAHYVWICLGRKIYLRDLVLGYKQ